jgi:hypothetical protein
LKAVEKWGVGGKKNDPFSSIQPNFNKRYISRTAYMKLGYTFGNVRKSFDCHMEISPHPRGTNTETLKQQGLT